MRPKHIFFFVFFIIILSSVNIFADNSYDMRIACSSFLDKNPKYAVQNLFDNDTSTCWAEGAKNDGSGLMSNKIAIQCDHFFVFSSNFNDGRAEQFLCIFDPPISFNKLKIFNGYGKSKQLWQSNNRVKKLGIIINGWVNYIEFLEQRKDEKPDESIKITINLQDKEWNDIDLTSYLDNPGAQVSVNNIEFFILETYKGKNYNDTCLSEVQFFRNDEKYSLEPYAIQDNFDLND